MRQPLWLSLLLALVTVLAGTSGAAQAQDKSLFWRRYDVNISVQQNSDILVEEIQQIEFTSGTFRFGFAAIPLDRVEDIVDVSVSELIDGSEQPYTADSTHVFGFTTTTRESDLEITWYFPPTNNTQHTYILRYRVVGGLRFYDGGDQIWWKAIAPDHNFPIRTSRVTVTLPQNWPQEQLVVASYGAPATNSYSGRGQVVFEAQNIAADEELEVRVQFPHGLVQGSPLAWQLAFDRRQQWGPVVGILAGALGLILLVGGPLAVYLLWYTRGRDRPTVSVPEYITEPPDDLPAAVVGTLIDEKAEMKDIVACILDLAHCGALRMEEEIKEGFLGIGSGRDYVFYLEDASQATLPHEKQLLKRIFGTGQVRRLRDLRQKFYTAIPEIRSQLYRQVVQEGFFHKTPEETRQRWGCLGVLGLIGSVALAILLLVSLGSYSAAAACPGIALGITMLSLIFVSRHMPHKTPKGAEAAAKWLAFKRYLETIEKHSDLESVKDKFEAYLPYAMVFGLERRLIKKFAAIDTPAPRWWGPVMVPHHGYPYGHGGVGRSGESQPGGPPGPLAGEGGQAPTLTGMSESIGTSLASMSASLGTMLSSASTTLASTPPQSSGGGGGGGFSGGGFSGGGGGGGGSRGFG